MMRLILVLAILCAFCGRSTFAQGTAEKAVAALTATEPDALKEGNKDAGARLYVALIGLEERFLKSRNLRRAQIVRKAIDDLEEVHGGFELEELPEARIVLKPDGAKTTGAIRLDRSKGVLVGWKNKGNTATWDVGQMEPGLYELHVQYSVGETQTDGGKRRRAGGLFAIRQLSNLAGESAERIVHEVASTGGWDKFSVTKIGMMAFSRTSATIVAECGEAEELGVMHLRGVELRKISASSKIDGDALEQDFIALKAAHAREVASLNTSIERRYVEALRGLGANPKAQKEIARIVGSKGNRRGNQENGGNGKSGEFLLLATDERNTSLSGKAVIHSSKGYVTGLRPPGTYVQWDLGRFPVPAGDYEVSMDFRTTEKMGGEFRIYCGSEILTRSVRIGPFGSMNRDFRSQRLGRLRVTPSVRSIRLEPLELESRDGSLCDLRSLTLIPLDAVKEKVEHSDGYIEWNGVTFVESPANTGDRFAVRHQGKTHLVQLYAIQCPPGSTRETRGDDFASSRDHFGVSANDLARGGRQATQATKDSLAGKPFSIFTKGKKTSTSALYAWVVIEGDTLLSGRLVEEGLGEKGGELSSVPAAICKGIDERKYQSWLDEKEKEASAAKQGIWRYRRD